MLYSNSQKNKEDGEKQQIELLKKYEIDFVVLARYMQIISSNLISLYENKIIGATSHYVTAELDEVPIIEQDIARVSHINSIEDFIMKGRDLERIVLARAINLHAEHKTMVYNNKTVVFY